jgi:hypothetical protein
MHPVALGRTDDTYDRDRLFVVPAAARRKHMAIFGTTGSGKSTLLRNMVVWDIANGLGVTVLDPHGGLIDDVLEHIPRERTNDVIYFSPKNLDWALGLNILEPTRPDQRPLVVSNLVSVFKKIWKDSWGPRLEDILRNVAFALVEQPRAVSVVAIPRVLTDREYRAKILQNVSNPVVQGFFADYERWTPSFREEAIAPVMNKVRAFTANPLLRGIIGQARSSFDFRWMMDSGKILLCDLSKGALGEEVSALLGSLIVTKLSLAALSREDIPEDHRRPHLLYVEEAQNFIADFPTILSEARKYRLALVLVIGLALERLAS